MPRRAMASIYVMAGKLMYQYLGPFLQPGAPRLLLLVLLGVASLAGASIVRSLASSVAPTYPLICDHANPSPIGKSDFGNLRDDVDPAYPVKVVLGRQRFSIPSGYFSHAITAQQIECGSLRDNVSLQYWIPSLDAPEGRIIYHGTDNRPKERRRPQPAAKESVVHVFTIGLDDWADRKRSGRIRSGNLTLDRPDLTKEHGLWKTPPNKSSLETVYWFGESSSEYVVIECHVRSRCSMIVDIKDLALTAYIIFDRGIVAEHRTIVSGLKTLLYRWRTPSFLPTQPASVRAH